MHSPSGGQFRHRVPAKFQRVVPLYLAFIGLVLFIFNADLIFSSSPPSPSTHFKRSSSWFTRQKPLVPAQGIPPTFPKKIWQSWKVGPLGFEERDSLTARTWTDKNSEYRYEVLTDDNDQSYVELHYGPQGFNRPDIVDMYRNLNARIIKADILRYLIMYAEGGVYADIDVEALKPISRFIPERYAEADVDMVIGVEIDQPEFADHPVLGKKSKSFCQWTFMCKPRLPVMLALVEHIMAWLESVSAQQGKPISEIELDFDEVISGTGPSAFTTAILAEMSKREGKDVDWSPFHAMGESKLVGGVLVLTVEAFAAGQGHSDSGNHNARTALVKHHYHASAWPSKHPRFSHPVYAEVERCNWEAECVRAWDENVAAFDQLGEEDQLRLVEAKEEEDRRQAEEFNAAVAAKEEADRKALEEFGQAVKEKEEADKKAQKELEEFFQAMTKENAEKANQQALGEGTLPSEQGKEGEGEKAELFKEEVKKEGEKMEVKTEEKKDEEKKDEEKKDEEKKTESDTEPAVYPNDELKREAESAANKDLKT